MAWGKSWTRLLIASLIILLMNVGCIETMKQNPLRGTGWINRGWFSTNFDNILQIEFAENQYRIESAKFVETGTYKVSGDTIIFRPNDDEEHGGTFFGETLEVYEIVFVKRIK
jgi:hypothetical protein